MTRGKVKQLRQLIEQLAVTLDDETALTGVELFPAWAIGKAYAVNHRVQYNGTLYKCIPAHTTHITPAIRSATTASTMFAHPTPMFMRPMCTAGI